MGFLIEMEAIRVADMSVSYSEFLEFYVPAVQRYKSEGVAEEEINQKKKQVVEHIVRGLLLIHLASRYDVAISQKDAESMVVDIVAQTGSTPEEYTEKLYRETGIPSLKQFTWELRQHHTQQRLLQQMQLLPDFFIRPVVQADIENCYQEQYAGTLSSQRRTVSHIVVQTDDPSPFSESSKAALKKASDIRAQIVSGERSFQEMAQEHSDDRFTRDQGGELGTFYRSDLSAYSATFALDYGKALFDLEEGQVSEILHSKTGLHIVRADKIVSGEKMDLRDAQEPCRRKIADTRYQELLQKELAQLYEEVPISVNVQ